MDESTDDGLLGTSAAAESIGVAGKTLRQWMRDGRVRPAALTVGGHARWDLAELRVQLARLNGART